MGTGFIIRPTGFYCQAGSAYDGTGTDIPSVTYDSILMNSNPFDVSQKVVVVTGASRGIGRAVAEGFLDQGARVILSARSESLLEQVSGYHSDRARAFRADLAETDVGQRLCGCAIDAFGRIDVLVNNAAVTLPGAPPYDDSTWQTTLDVNLTGAFRVARETANTMVGGGGGSIIQIASIAGTLGMPDNPSYQVAKAGLRQLSRAMARDFASSNIRVNTICPGYILTDMTRASFEDPQRRAERTARTMLGRWGQPEELVGPCLFLASDASSYITATDLFVDGGWSGKGM